MGNLSTPKSVQKLQMALHAKAKAEAERAAHHLDEGEEGRLLAVG